MRTLRISKSGALSFIWNDAFASLVDHGEARVVRASHVEPNEDGQWIADLSPVNGPTFGPFVKRADALAAEVEWLRTNMPEATRVAFGGAA